MHHILDDFFIVAASYVACKQQLDRFLHFCAHIGVPMAPHKMLGPTVLLTFVGILLDSIKMQASLPLDKLDDCKREIQALLDGKKATLKKLQSINGKLNFACSVVLPGRCFLRRLNALTAGLQKPHHTQGGTRGPKNVAIFLGSL